MEKYSSGLVSALFIILSSFIPLTAAEMNVTDYYKLCPANYFSGHKPQLEFKDGSWRTDVGMGVAEVDIKNGYIECSARGDGENIMQFVLYIKSDKTPVVAINRYYHEGVGPSQSTSITFYEYRNKELKDVTGKILPPIDYRLFIKPGFKSASLDNIKSFRIEHYLEYRYRLPQKGTTATAELLTEKLRNYLKNNNSIPASEKKICDDLLYNLYYNMGVELNWDAKKDRYVPGKLIKVY